MGKNKQKRNLYFYSWDREYLATAMKCDRVTVNIKELEYDESIDDFTRLKNNGVEVFIYLPVLWNEESLEIDEALDIVSGIYVGNIGQIEKVRKTGIKMLADAALNTYNLESIKFWATQGFEGAVLSYELDSDIREIYENINGNTFFEELELEVLRYGRVPAMVSEYCPLAGAEGVRGTGCGKCMQHNPVYLKDSYGDRYPVILDDGSCSSLILSKDALNRKNSSLGLRNVSKGIERITVFDESPSFIARL